MRAYLIGLLTLLFVSHCVSAQDNNVALMAQSADGKTVKLYWTINTWNNAITGFDIKRREGTQGWVKLNTAPILPGIFTKKKLAISGANHYEESLLKPKLYKLISTRKLQDMDCAKYLVKLNNNPNELKEISALMAEDYDIAFLAGFGYLDHSLVNKNTYEYGVFIQGTDKLLAKTTWNFGQIPDMDVVQELTSKASVDGKGIKVIWLADTTKIRLSRIAGFNIYRDGIRLNTNRITTEDQNDLTMYIWNDKYANTTTATQYSIAAESIFNIEGIIRNYAYDPTDHPKEYKKAEVTEIASIGYYFKEGTSIKWSFPREYEKYIKGFYIEKDNMPAGYNEVTGLIDASARSFVDKTPSQANGYVRVKVKTQYKDRSMVPGVERLFCYLPLTEPPAPQNVKVKSISGQRMVTAYLNWDGPVAGDTVTTGYKVYTFEDNVNKFVAISEVPAKAHNLTYKIEHGTAGVRRFCVTALNKLNVESAFSDTVAVQIPSLELPPPTIKSVIPDDHDRATITWQYPEILDLKGFRLTQNGKVIASETELKKNTREFLTNKLEEGGSYEFTIMSISDIGVMSPSSASFRVVVTLSSKK